MAADPFVARSVVDDASMPEREDAQILTCPIHIDDRAKVTHSQLVRVDGHQPLEVSRRVLRYLLQLPYDPVADRGVELAETVGCQDG